MIRWIFTLQLILTVSSAAFGAEFALIGGLHSSDVDSTTAAAVDGKSGGHLGFLGFVDLAGESRLRAGAIFSRHKFEIGNATELKPKYLEVPVSYMYMLNEGVGIFAGPQVALTIDEECDSTAGVCSAVDFENLLWSVSFGGEFYFTPNLGAELTYVYGVSDVTSSTENLTSLMISGLFLF